jgi:hypothetical protein
MEIMQVVNMGRNTDFMREMMAAYTAAILAGKEEKEPEEDNSRLAEAFINMVSTSLKDIVAMLEEDSTKATLFKAIVTSQISALSDDVKHAPERCSRMMVRITEVFNNHMPLSMQTDNVLDVGAAITHALSGCDIAIGIVAEKGADGEPDMNTSTPVICPMLDGAPLESDTDKFHAFMNNLLYISTLLHMETMEELK